MKIVFLGIGTNLGNRESNLEEAVARIEESSLAPLSVSSSIYDRLNHGVFMQKMSFSIW
jgi:7,8-dihydro-6-hydroxymethylpterin-pyrophosphokinase